MKTKNYNTSLKGLTMLLAFQASLILLRNFNIIQWSKWVVALPTLIFISLFIIVLIGGIYVFLKNKDHYAGLANRKKNEKKGTKTV